MVLWYLQSKKLVIGVYSSCDVFSTYDGILKIQVMLKLKKRNSTYDASLQIRLMAPSRLGGPDQEKIWVFGHFGFENSLQSLGDSHCFKLLIVAFSQALNQF